MLPAYGQTTSAVTSVTGNICAVIIINIILASFHSPSLYDGDVAVLCPFNGFPKQIKKKRKPSKISEEISFWLPFNHRRRCRMYLKMNCESFQCIAHIARSILNILIAHMHTSFCFCCCGRFSPLHSRPMCSRCACVRARLCFRPLVMMVCVRRSGHAFRTRIPVHAEPVRM